MDWGRLLVAEADTTLREQLLAMAETEGYLFSAAPDGIAALKLFRREQFNLAVLDTDLPELDGRLVCREIRKSAVLPIILLSGDGSETARLLGFQAGGNDYLVKPVYLRELFARVKSLLGLCAGSMHSSRLLAVGGVCIDTQSRCVYVDESEISLTPKEYDLFLFFCSHPNRAFSRDTLLNLVWGQHFIGTDRTVDTHVRSLRDKIRPYQDYIVTVWGVGYKFVA